MGAGGGGPCLLYGLYLAGDIQRVLLRDYYERLSRVHWRPGQTEATGRKGGSCGTTRRPGCPGAGWTGWRPGPSR